MEFRGYDVASETIFGPKRCFSEARRQSFYMQHAPFLPIAPYSTAWFRLSDRSLISQATPFADRSVGRTENCWKTRSFALFAGIPYYVATCRHAVCVPWRLPSIGPILIWRRQASHGEGKSGPVETGLTGPVATALQVLANL